MSYGGTEAMNGRYQPGQEHICEDKSVFPVDIDRFENEGGPSAGDIRHQPRSAGKAEGLPRIVRPSRMDMAGHEVSSTME